MEAQFSVPAITYEEHQWVAEPDGMSGRARRARASGSYQSCVPSRIKDYSPDLPSDVAADVEEAAAALAQLDTFVSSAMDDADVETPMGAILLRTESASSSQIEQLTVGARQLGLAEISQSTSENAKTVMGNVRAMESALAIAGDIDESTILAIHRRLLSNQAGWEQHAGQYRQQLVWVGRSGLGPVNASFVAPEPELVPGAMADVVCFMNRLDLPVIVQIAVAHAQFETIHPFVDGNGRTGRALIHAMLRRSGLVTHIAVPLSAGLLVDTERYFDSLNSYRKGDTLPIVQQFTDASRFAARSGTKLIQDLRNQVDKDRALLAGLRPQAIAWRVLPWLSAHPVLNARTLIDELGLSEISAQRTLSQLTSAGVLVERTGLRRNRVWQHEAILSILDEYAAGLRRSS